MKVLLFLLFPVLCVGPLKISGQKSNLDLGELIEFKTDDYGLLYYQRIIDVEKDSAQIYKEIKIALTYLYESSIVVQYDSPEKIIVEGYFEVPYLINQVKVKHTLVIDIKEGRVRFTFKNLFAQYHYTHDFKPLNSKGSFTYPESYWKKIREKTMNEIQGVIKYMQNSLDKDISDDDW